MANQASGKGSKNGNPFDTTNPPSPPIGVVVGDLLATSNAGEVVTISDTGSGTAAVVSGPSSTITTYSPPTESLEHIFYNNSYRYRLKTPSGYVGIRG